MRRERGWGGAVGVELDVEKKNKDSNGPSSFLKNFLINLNMFHSPLLNFDLLCHLL